MTVLEILLPLLIVVLLSLPLVKVFTGKVSAKSAKTRLAMHVSGFAGAVLLCLLLTMSNSGVFAAGDVVYGGKTVVEAVAVTKMVAKEIED